MPPPSDPQDPSGPCGAQPPNLFCDDFDSETEFAFAPPNTVDMPWEWISVNGGGQVLAFDAVHFTSSPRSAKFYEPPNPTNVDGGYSQAQIGKDNPAGALTTSFRFAFDLRLDVDALTSGPGQIGVSQFHFANLGEWDVVVENGGLALYISPPAGGSVRLSLGASVGLRQWMRAVVAFDKASGASVILNGGTPTTNPVLVGTPPGAMTNMLVGGTYVTGTVMPLTLEIDNVVLQGQ
jgi:hypothetical protein